MGPERSGFYSKCREEGFKAGMTVCVCVCVYLLLPGPQGKLSEACWFFRQTNQGQCRFDLGVNVRWLVPTGVDLILIRVCLC